MEKGKMDVMYLLLCLAQFKTTLCIYFFGRQAEKRGC